MSLVVGIVVAIALAAALVRGLLLGYPRATLEPSVLSAKEQAILIAVADTFFPPGGRLHLSGSEAGAVAFFDGMLRDAPWENRLRLRAALQLLEHGPWLVNVRARLTRQSPAARLVTLRAWSESPSYLLRIACLGVRTLLAMAYLENSEIEAGIGAKPDLDPFAQKVSASA